MMGSCSLWLLLVALLPPVRIAPAYCQHTENHRLTFLVAIKSNGSGLEIHTQFPENHGSRSQPELESKMHFIPNRSLSSECGDQYFRCQQFLVETLSIQNGSGDVNYTIFVPLENGVLLLSCWYDSNNMAVEKRSFIVSSFNCSPTVIYKFSSKIYTVCINSHYFAIYEIQFNGSVIENASLVGPLTQISNIHNSSNFTNFVLIEDKVYFAVHNYIAVMDPSDKAKLKIYPQIQNCTQIHRLATFCACHDSESQQLLLAYCKDRYVCFNPDRGDWCDVQLFSSNGVPYLCPDNNYKATLLFDDILQFSGSSLNTIHNVSVSSGVCFESQNNTYFVYSDQQNNNVYIYDFTTQNHYPVSPYDCSAQNCPQLLISENQYLVIRDANYSLVLDTKTNFNSFINISNGIADILVFLHGNVYSAITPSPPIIHSTTSAKVPPEPGMNHHYYTLSTIIYIFYLQVCHSIQCYILLQQSHLSCITLLSQFLLILNVVHCFMILTLSFI